MNHLVSSNTIFEKSKKDSVLVTKLFIEKTKPENKLKNTEDNIKEEYTVGKVPVKIQYTSKQSKSPVSRISWMLAGPIVNDFDKWLEDHPDFLEIDFDSLVGQDAYKHVKPNSEIRMHEHWAGGDKGSVGKEHPVGQLHHSQEIQIEHREEINNYKKNFDKKFALGKVRNPKIIEKSKKLKELREKLTLEQQAERDAEKDYLKEKVHENKLQEELENIRDDLDYLKDEDCSKEEYRDKYNIQIRDTFINPSFPPYGKSKDLYNLIPAESFQIMDEGSLKEYDSPFSEEQIIPGKSAANFIVTYETPRISRNSERELRYEAHQSKINYYYLFIRHDGDNLKNEDSSVKKIERYDSRQEVENRREELFSATDKIIEKFGSYTNFKNHLKDLPIKERITFQNKWENEGTPLRLKYGLSNELLEKKRKKTEEKDREKKQEEHDKKIKEEKVIMNKLDKIKEAAADLKIKQDKKIKERIVRQEASWTTASIDQVNRTNNYLEKRSKEIDELINGSAAAGKIGNKIGYLNTVKKFDVQINKKRKELWTPDGKKRQKWIIKPAKFKLKEYSYDSNVKSLKKAQKALEKINKLWEFNKKTKTYIPTVSNENAYKQYIFVRKLEKKLNEKQQLEDEMTSTNTNINSINNIKEEIDNIIIRLEKLREESGYYQKKEKSLNTEKSLRKSIIENINNLEILWKSSKEEAERLKEKRLIINKMNSLIGEWECDPERIQNADTFNTLYSEFQSGEDKVKLEGEDNQYKVSTNGVNSLVTESFKEALAKYYSSVSRIMDAQNNNKDLALELFGEHVLNTSRNTRKLMAELDKMTEVKMLENLDYSQLSIPFNSDFIIKYEPQSDVFGIVPRTYDSTEVESQNNPGGKIGRKDLKESDYEEIELHPDEQDPIEEELSEPGIGTDGANLITKTDKPSLNQPQLLPYRQEENKRTEKVEAPIKVKETYSQNLHPPEEKAIEGQHGVD